MIRTIPVILFAAVAAAQPEYTITEITSWSEAQLATLTGFSRFVPVNPPGSPAGFVPLEHAGLYTAGVPVVPVRRGLWRACFGHQLHLFHAGG
jgi:hypothetical protein